MPIIDLDEVIEDKKTSEHEDIFMGGSYTSIMRPTMKKMKCAATLEVYLVVLGLPRVPLWLWMCDMLTPDLYEVDENKKLFYMRTFL